MGKNEDEYYQKDKEIVSCEMPKSITRAMDTIIVKDMHSTRSEFIREALRAHIEKHARKLGIELEDIIKEGEKRL